MKSELRTNLVLVPEKGWILEINCPILVKKCSKCGKSIDSQRFYWCNALKLPYCLACSERPTTNLCGYACGVEGHFSIIEVKDEQKK